MSAEPNPEEASALRTTRRITSLLVLGLVAMFPVFFAFGAVRRGLFLVLAGAYASIILAYLIWGARCPRCRYHLGRLALRSGTSPRACPSCGLDVQGGNVL